MLPERCELCPRRCGVDRRAGERGFCGSGKDLEIYRYGLHRGEEPPLSLSRGSGTVFFSRCTLRCLYCQNHPWSQGGAGESTRVGELTAVFRRLREEGAHNWNLVSPTPWLPLIRAALEPAEQDGIRLPVVYNTSGYERVPVLESCASWVDVYLTDLRYARPETALEGSGAADYVAVAREALAEMWRQKGPLRLGPDGAAMSGTICRLLVLPGRAGEAIESLEWLAEAVGTALPVSVMGQYVPAHRAVELPAWNRRVTGEEYREVCEAVERLGFCDGWIQDLEASSPRDLIGFEMKSGAGTT